MVTSRNLKIISVAGLRPLTKKEREARDATRAAERARQEAHEQAILEEAARAEQAMAQAERALAQAALALQRWECFTRELGLLSRKAERQAAVEQSQELLQQRREALLRCDRGDIVRKRVLRKDPREIFETLHVKGEILTIRNMRTRQRESAPVSTLLLTRRVDFEVDVFSMDDHCNKTVGGLNADMTVSSLVQMIKHEFGLASRMRIEVTYGDHKLSTYSLEAPLGKCGLGLSAGIPGDSWGQFAFTVLSKRFDLKILDLAGVEICIPVVHSDVCLEEVLHEIEQMETPEEGYAWRLACGSQVFSAWHLGQTLSQLGIEPGSMLTRAKVRAKICPQCKNSKQVKTDVTIGSTHEGWGLRWNTCDYSCSVCGDTIKLGASVNACDACRCFWHEGC